MNFKTIIFSLALLLSFNLEAQTFTVAASSAFDVESGKYLNYSIEVEGKSFQVFENKSGTMYIKAISSKTGKPYPVWIGEKTKHTFEGQPVRKSKKGSYSILVLSKAGYPYNKWLKLEE